ncbi:MAG: hypothetical protein ACE5GZ_12455 [Gammaproteobacteria bacterium]
MILPEQAAGVHLVGSVPFDNCRQVFQNVAAILGNYIHRLPDGETGVRSNWVDWQLPILQQNPNLKLVSNKAYEYTQIKMLGLRSGCNSKNLQLGDLGYSNAALASFEEFQKLKSSGDIPRHCRFQVCLPTPLATTHLYVEQSLQPDFEPQYADRLSGELKQILDAIPHDELAIQWDTAVEFALLEGVMPSCIEDLQQGIIDRLLRLTTTVPEPVELGFHLCYGDSRHKHFCEPEDTGKLVLIANAIAAGVERELNWIHMPVPKDRSDDAYFKPLVNLRLAENTQLYLGLVHYSDGEAGTRRRIKTAKKYVTNFGVATECGFGRRAPDTLDELMHIHVAVSMPVV